MITVTAASGKFGHLVIEDLIERGVPAADIVAAVRNPAAAGDLAARGVAVRAADYSQPDTLASALTGAETLLFISGSEVGQRIPQHQNVIDAAVAAGVRRIVYTSILRADTSALGLAAEHLVTENSIRESGLPYAFLRNSWYLENYTENLAPALEHGAILGSSGDGRVAAATRADYAAAAAAVLTEPGPDNTAYELGGDEPFSMAELAAEVSKQAGVAVVYRDLPVADYAAALVTAGLPEVVADRLAASSAGLGQGELDTDSHDLSRLIGRPTTSLADAVATALKS